MYGIYVYDEKDIREQLTDTLMERGKLSKPTDDDVDACSEYLYDKFAELFDESISDFVDENWLSKPTDDDVAGDDMTATEKLRAMLDERGVELDADYMLEGSKARQAYLIGVEDGMEQGEAVGFMNGTDEIGKLEAKINTLQSCLSETAENAKQTIGEYKALQAENAKLRELVRDSASLLDATCDTYYEDDYHAIIDRMRELGVEVYEVNSFRDGVPWL